MNAMDWPSGEMADQIERDSAVPGDGLAAPPVAGIR
jgi:hypothetical protein